MKYIYNKHKNYHIGLSCADKLQTSWMFDLWRQVVDLYGWVGSYPREPDHVILVVTELGVRLTNSVVRITNVEHYEHASVHLRAHWQYNLYLESVNEWMNEWMIERVSEN